jgi:DnaJ-class molecular chaperone
MMFIRAYLSRAQGAHTVMGKDYYTDLGLTRSATDVDIKKAYRKLSLKYHPDKDESAHAAKVFAAVAEAYDVLSEAKCKGFYDLYGEEGLKRGVTDGKGGRRGGFYAFEKAPTSVFASFFGTDNPYKALNELAEAFEALTATPKFKAGKAIRAELPATLEEVRASPSWRVLRAPLRLLGCTACRGAKTAHHGIGAPGAARHALREISAGQVVPAFGSGVPAPPTRSTAFSIRQRSASRLREEGGTTGAGC